MTTTTPNPEAAPETRRPEPARRVHAFYRTSGSLAVPVTDLEAARKFLDVEGGMAQFIYPAELQEIIADVRWDLLNEQEWIVRVVAIRPLDETESKQMSSWISGQNSDGLGEGFEQQDFAEGEGDSGYWAEDDEEDPEMASFDWETNDCTLTKEER